MATVLKIRSALREHGESVELVRAAMVRDAYPPAAVSGIESFMGALGHGYEALRAAGWLLVLSGFLGFCATLLSLLLMRRVVTAASPPAGAP